MRDLFKVLVDQPEEENMIPGRIRIEFQRPDIYFGFQYYDDFLCRHDKKHHEEYQEHRAIDAFLNLIREELKSAFKKAKTKDEE